MVLVEIDSTSGAFQFREFRTLQKSKNFCREISKHKTLTAFIANK